MRPSLHRPALAALLALAALAATLAPSRARAESYWLDGYEVEVTLKPERDTFVLGEPVMLRLNFEGRSDTELELMLSAEGGGWPDDFDVSVTGPGGESVARPEGRRPDDTYDNVALRGPLNMRGSHAWRGRRPEMTLVLPLSDWAKIEEPGLYTVTLRRGVRAGPYNGRRYRILPGTTMPAVEIRLQTRLEITSPGEDGVGRLVEELSASMLACNQDSSVAATTRLGGLEDARVVRPLAEAVARCRNPSIKYQALQGISKFDTDAAFEALRAAAADPDEDFRTVVAKELATNRHPKALPLLLSMRRDPYYGVRLMVLNALERRDTESSRRIIWEMTQDEHPMVREEALRFLQQRPTPSRP